jgi:hypothetical protein
MAVRKLENFGLRVGGFSNPRIRLLHLFFVKWFTYEILHMATAIDRGADGFPEVRSSRRNTSNGQSSPSIRTIPTSSAAPATSGPSTLRQPGKV